MLDSLTLLHTPPYPCSYLPEHMARSQVVSARTPLSPHHYDHLIQTGFRRSGPLCYRPDCDLCRACLSVRLVVRQLRHDRSQKRAIRRHQPTLSAQETPLVFCEEHYALYRRYQESRHPGGGMDNDQREEYAQFLLEGPARSHLIEFRESGVLRMVSLIDRVADGLSAVYCFFEPGLAGSSFGTFNILWQADCCQRLGLPYLYLGYWIENSRKMAYKAHFRPLEVFVDGRWQVFPGH